MTRIPTDSVGIAERHRSHASLRSELRDKYLSAGGWERVSYKQLDQAEEMIRYLSRVQRRSGDHILRSIPQIAKGLGLPIEGLSVRQIRDRFEDRITSSLGFLELAGYVDRVERNLRHPNGAGIGIVVVLPAGVAQSVRAAEKLSRDRLRRQARRNSPPPSGSSFGAKFPPPSGGLQGVANSESLSRCRREQLEAAGARARLGTRDRALARFPVRAALEAATTADPEGGGRALVEARPELAGAPIEVVAREAWRRAGHPDGRLSSRGAQRLQHAAAQLERVGYTGLTGPAASRAAIFDLALGDWCDHWQIKRADHKAPQTVGGLACCLRTLARKLTGKWYRRAAARATPPSRPEGRRD